MGGSPRCFTSLFVVVRSPTRPHLPNNFGEWQHTTLYGRGRADRSRRLCVSPPLGGYLLSYPAGQRRGSGGRSIRDDCPSRLRFVRLPPGPGDEGTHVRYRRVSVLRCGKRSGLHVLSTVRDRSLGGPSTAHGPNPLAVRGPSSLRRRYHVRHAPETVEVVCDVRESRSRPGGGGSRATRGG